MEFPLAEDDLTYILSLVWHWDTLVHRKKYLTNGNGKIRSPDFTSF